MNNSTNYFNLFLLLFAFVLPSHADYRVVKADADESFQPTICYRYGKLQVLNSSGMTVEILNLDESATSIGTVNITADTQEIDLSSLIVGDYKVRWNNQTMIVLDCGGLWGTQVISRTYDDSIPCVASPDTPIGGTITEGENCLFGCQVLTGLTAGTWTFYDSLTNVCGEDSVVVLTLDVSELPVPCMESASVISSTIRIASAQNAGGSLQERNQNFAPATKAQKSESKNKLSENQSICHRYGKLQVTGSNGMTVKVLNLDGSATSIADTEIYSDYMVEIDLSGLAMGYYMVELNGSIMYILNGYEDTIPSLQAGESILFGCNLITPTEMGTFEYQDSLENYCGEDSIITLVLTVEDVPLPCEETTSEVSVSVCEGETFVWNGQTYYQSGTYVDTLLNECGSDSICILNLTVLTAVDMLVTDTMVCEADLPVVWHDMTLTTAGVYYDTLRYQETGCDSLRYTLNLTVNAATTMPIEEIAACAKELPVVWQGRSFTAAGLYYDTMRYSNGCDSICRSLRLIVHSETTTTETAAICDGETYTWHNRQLRKQGTYYDTLLTVAGCDSICALNLTVNPSYYIEEIVSIREDKLPYQWQGRTLTEAGTYVADYTTVNTGCDSIITLQLMVTALPIYRVDVMADHGHVNGTGTYPEGTQIILTAVPDEGFEFQMWSDGTTTNPKTFTVMQDTTFRAHFFMPEVEQEVTVDSIETNSVTITWDTVPGAVLYELRIYKNGELVVTYEVDPDNNIVGEHHIGPDHIVARKDSTGGSSETLQVNVGGLEPGQDYTYSLDALDDDRSYVGAQSGTFTTEDEPIDGLEPVTENREAGTKNPRKVLRDGRLYLLLPDGTLYDARGGLIE